MEDQPDAASSGRFSKQCCRARANSDWLTCSITVVISFFTVDNP